MSGAWRPYLNLDRSIRELYGLPDRYLRETIGKESEYEKPYLDEEYRAMHLNMPTPDWGSEHDWGVKWNALHLSSSRGKRFRRFSFGAGNQDEEQSNESTCKYCILTCWKAQNCNEPTDCHENVFCTTDPTGNGSDIDVLKQDNPPAALGTGRGYGDAGDAGYKDDSGKQNGSLTFYALKGAIKSIAPNSWTVGADVWVDENQPLNVIQARLVDGLGNKCFAQFEIACACSCPAEVPFTFDDASTADTIARSSSITIYTLGGCGPFTWSVAGTGFSIPGTTAEGVNNNTLSADGTACGAATITVTDTCSTALTIYIRCTTGGWVLKDICRTTNAGNCCCWGCTLYTCEAAVKWIYSGNKAWDFANPFCGDSTASHTWIASAPWPCNASSLPPCGGPEDCISGTCVGDCACGVNAVCTQETVGYHEWEC